MIECEHCDKRLERVGIARSWREIRVGSIDTDEVFHLCPGCKDLDPVEVYAESAEIYEVSRQ